MQFINSATLIEFVMLAQVCQFNLVNVEALVAFFWHVQRKSVEHLNFFKKFVCVRVMF